MNEIVKHFWRFVIFLIIQVLVLNQLEIGFGIQIMVYPLFIMMLPFEINIFLLLGLSFLLGIGIDTFSNTYGLHASSLLLFAYLRPVIFKLFEPRDGYDALAVPDLFSMGFKWFIKSFGILIVAHHLWFFILEMFKLNEILYVLQKTSMSFVISFVLCILMQFILIRRLKKQ